ncbi:MAG: DUF429 domain-containing protein [Vampirovibrio sp.]|nr:DUF429 domain-containing protein [Vampirovibrio sp.]
MPLSSVWDMILETDLQDKCARQLGNHTAESDERLLFTGDQNPMAVQKLYTKTSVNLTDIGSIQDKWTFTGVDLAPNDTLETGVSALDRNGSLIRMDKLNADKDIVAYIKALGPPSGIVVAIDIPKSLEIPGKWRQEEVKMHPLRLVRPTDGKTTDRYASRGWRLYDMLLEEGVMPLIYTNYQAKMRYKVDVPFRTRTPQGCRALQLALKQTLRIGHIPTNLAPISVLESMVGSYVAWSVFSGKESTHFSLYRDEDNRIHVEPRQRVR